MNVDQSAGAVVVHARPHRRAARRRGICGRRCPLYDPGRGRRRWRSLALGAMRAFSAADAPRVSVVTQLTQASARERHVIDPPR